MDAEVHVTPFQRRVYDETRKIPRGTVVSYGELARRIGCGSAQAVGQALRRNPFADGSLNGFAGERSGAALARKQALLESEGVVVVDGRVVGGRIGN